MNALSRVGWFVLAIGFASVAAASEAPCATCPQPVRYQRTCVTEDTRPSWVFRRSTFTNDPVTGARVAQYQRIAPVEPLEDERNVTSRYRRIQSTLRGPDGSSDTTYDVQAWGNGRGGPDAEWERFHDAWKDSYLQGGTFNQRPGWNGWGNGNWNGGWNNGGWGGQGNWGPGGGVPGWGPGNGGPNGPWQNSGGPNQQGFGGPH